MGTQTQFIKMTQIGMWMVEGERNRKQKKGENLCLLNICCVWNIKSITHIPPFNPHDSPLVDVMIPNLLIRTWRLNNIYKVKQWWSWGLKLGLWDFESLVFPCVPLAPKTVCFGMVPVNCPSHSCPSTWFSLIRSESPATFHPILHLLSPLKANPFVAPPPIWGPISPFRRSTLCSTCSLASTWPQVSFNL